MRTCWRISAVPDRRGVRDTCDFGLYRDDGLGVSKATPRQTDLIKKKLCTIFSKNGLRITIEVNKHTVNFLDMTLDLKNGTHRPFSKPGNIPHYVNSPDTITRFPFHRNQHVRHLPERIVPATSFGIIPRSAET